MLLDSHLLRRTIIVPPFLGNPALRLLSCAFSTHQTNSSSRKQLPPRSGKMSWMDSWSRPSKGQATPAPFYSIPGRESTPYCHSCGRVIGSRRATAAGQTDPTPVKYCSSRCRGRKPGKLDREIETIFVRLLNGDSTWQAESNNDSTFKASQRSGGKKQDKQELPSTTKRKQKGDPRRLISCEEVERLVFGSREQERVQEDHSGSESGEGEREAAQPVQSAGETTATGPTTRADPIRTLEGLEAEQKPHIDGDVLARMSVRSGSRIRPPQSVSEVNGSVGGEKGRAERIEETEEMLEKRHQGQKHAKEREMVRCAARRGVVFGFVVVESTDGKEGKSPKDQGADETTMEASRRKCEAVMLGKVVEPSFAKGDWSIRWRE